MRPNRLLVKYLAGYVVVEDSSDVTVRGGREGFLTLRVDTEQAAVAEAQRILDEIQPRVEAITIGVEPVTGSVPLVNFGVGDTLYAPSSDGGQTEQRVVAITVAHDEDGNLVYAPEIGQVWPDPDEEQRALFRRLGDTLGAQPRGAGSAVVERAGQVTLDPIPLRGVTADPISTGGGGGGAAGPTRLYLSWGQIGAPQQVFGSAIRVPFACTLVERHVGVHTTPTSQIQIATVQNGSVTGSNLALSNPDIEADDAPGTSFAAGDTISPYMALVDSGARAVGVLFVLEA